MYIQHDNIGRNIKPLNLQYAPFLAPTLLIDLQRLPQKESLQALPKIELL